MSRIETMGMHRVVVSSSYILEHWAQSVKDQRSDVKDDQRSDATARETIVRISERDEGSSMIDVQMSRTVVYVAVKCCARTGSHSI